MCVMCMCMLTVPAMLECGCASAMCVDMCVCFQCQQGLSAVFFMCGSQAQEYPKQSNHALPYYHLATRSLRLSIQGYLAALALAVPWSSVLVNVYIYIYVCMHIHILVPISCYALRWIR